MSRIVFLGNMKRDWCSEVHYSESFRALGHEIVFLQEDMTSIPEIVGQGNLADLLIYMRTYGTHDLRLGQAWQEIETNGCRTATISLDLYQGLPREEMVHHDYAAWATQWVFTADGDPAAEEMFAARGIQHVWLPPAVYGPEAHPGRWNPVYDYDVVFVGSHPTAYHPEWTWRAELLDLLTDRYGMSFQWLGKGGAPVIRGDALNDLYATARCAVGDSLCPMVPTPAGPRRKRNYWCADEETEILTTEGWKRHDALAAGDLAYTLDPTTEVGHWEPVLDVAHFPAGEQKLMLSMESRSHSSLTTLDHRWYTHRRSGRGAGPGFRTSATLTAMDSIPLAAPCADLPTEPKFSDAFVELVAWAWTEGSWDRRGYYSGITQSNRVNGPYVARIRRALTAECGSAVESLGRTKGHRSPRWRETECRPGLTLFALSVEMGRALGAVAPEHHVDPSFIAALTAAQLRLFIETSIDADGCRKSSMTRGQGPYSSTTIAQRDPWRLDAPEMACALLGIATVRSQAGPVWLLHIKRRTWATPARSDVGAGRVPVEYDGLVWCPVTPSGTWLARRRGTVYFTGNSDRIVESVGRGGVVVFPDVPGLAETYGLQDGEHCWFYQYGDKDGLYERIDWCILNPEEARAMALRGQAQLRDGGHTYVDRARTILHTVGLDVPADDLPLGT